MAGVVSDIPIKFVIAIVFNIILYFLAGLRAEPSQFFIYFLFVFVAILTMSSIFRSLAAMTKTLSQAMVCFLYTRPDFYSMLRREMILLYWRAPEM